MGRKKLRIDKNNYGPRNCNRFGVKLLPYFELPNINQKVYPYNSNIGLDPIKIPKI